MTKKEALDELKEYNNTVKITFDKLWDSVEIANYNKKNWSLFDQIRELCKLLVQYDVNKKEYTDNMVPLIKKINGIENKDIYECQMVLINDLKKETKNHEEEWNYIIQFLNFCKEMYS